MVAFLLLARLQYYYHQYCVALLYSTIHLNNNQQHLDNGFKNILLFGAGKSATALISYLLKKSEQQNWKLTVVDADIRLAETKTNFHPNASVLSFDINAGEERIKVISNADIVISMLPPALHYLIAKDCIICKKNLLTASYLDDKVKSLESDIKKSGLLFLCEMGLDPGIDHMSAMQLITRIKDKGGIIKSFKSHCGGLVAPESDNNPWHYKISWNPANVVNAGKSGAVYKENGETIQWAYADIFKDCKKIPVPALGDLAYYPNRDSLAYMHLYNLEQADTFIRTTLRHPEFCKGWQYIVDAGLTDTTNTSVIKNFRNTPVKYWFTSCLNFYHKAASFADYLNNIVQAQDRSLVKKQFDYIGLNSNEFIPDYMHTSADILQYLLETKLKLKEADKDMVVMLHEIIYEHNKTLCKVSSSLIAKGDDSLHTAMAKTVGLPLAIATELLLNNTILIKGLHIPVIKEIYDPVLAKLEENNISFMEIQ